MTPSNPDPGRARRRLLLGAAGTAALAGGIATAWWRHVRPGQADDPAVAALWARSFERPEGGQLIMASLRGRPLLVNFWATWCAPCVRELPAIDRFHRDFMPRGWQVVGLAIDATKPVREFLATKVSVGFPIGLAGLEGAQLLRGLGNDRGGLPFTIALDAQGRAFEHKLGETHYDELVAWARRLG